MAKTTFLATLFFLCCTLLFPVPASAEEERPRGDAEAPEGRDWLEFYYESPEPERFVEKMKDWAADGTLQNHGAQPALIGFISQLMRQNRGRIARWRKDLAGLDPDDQLVFSTSLLFSRTSEADDLLEAASGRKISDEERPPKILELQLDQVATINMLWGFFYATGSESAIRRIVRSFRFEDAPRKPEGFDIPEGYQPFYLEIPRIAHVSLGSNMQRHPRVVEICEKILTSEKALHPAEERNLYGLLSGVKPEKFPPREGAGESRKE